MATKEQKELLRDRVLSSVGKAAGQGNILGDKLTGFLAQEGCRYKRDGGLMVVGRSVNGWTDCEDPVTFADCGFREQYAHSLWQKSFPQHGKTCPMAWVQKQWGAPAPEDYNPKRSAFWRVIKQVTEELKICNAGDDKWASHLVWSNLYKVSPAAGRNPGERLQEVQRDGCNLLFEREIQDYSPKFLLLLTGENYWAQPFLKNFDVDHGTRGQYVCCTAQPSDPRCSSTLTVVAVHPQCKPEQKWVNEVKDAFIFLKSRRFTHQPN